MIKEEANLNKTMKISNNSQKNSRNWILKHAFILDYLKKTGPCCYVGIHWRAQKNIFNLLVPLKKWMFYHHSVWYFKTTQIMKILMESVIYAFKFELYGTSYDSKLYFSEIFQKKLVFCLLFKQKISFKSLKNN